MALFPCNSGSGGTGYLLTYTITASESSNTVTFSFTAGGTTACSMTFSHASSNSTSGSFTIDGVTHSVSMSALETNNEIKCSALTIDGDSVLPNAITITTHASSGSKTGCWRLNQSSSGLETTLWENSSPTSAQGSGSLTLSQSMDGFAYIKIYYRYSTSNATTVSITQKVSELTYKGASSWQYDGCIAFPTSTYAYVRYYVYRTSTALGISNAIWVENVSTAQNSYCIVTKIVGIN